MSTSTLIYSGPLPDLLPMTDRAPGLHVSTIIHDLALRLGWYKESDEGPPQTKMGLGCALEHAIAHRMMIDAPGKYYRWWDEKLEYWRNDLAVECDGIHMTLDLLDLEDWAVEDVKLTWMSSRHDPDGVKFKKFWVQIMAYCHGVGSTIGRIRAAHPRGDYKETDVVYNVWERRFEQEEIDRNWTMLKNHAQRMERGDGR